MDKVVDSNNNQYHQLLNTMIIQLMSLDPQKRVMDHSW